MLGTASGSHFDRAGSTRCASTNALVPAVSEVPAFMIAFATLSDTSQTHPSAKSNAMTLSGRFVFPGDQVADDRIAIRKGRVCLHKRLPGLAKVAEHKMEVMTE
jgi:hypothetical protein